MKVHSFKEITKHLFKNNNQWGLFNKKHKILEIRKFVILERITDKKVYKVRILNQTNNWVKIWQILSIFNKKIKEVGISIWWFLQINRTYIKWQKANSLWLKKKIKAFTLNKINQIYSQI